MMRKRCLKPDNPWYYNYGARGISICDEWSDFAVFREWALGSGYQKGLELDRVDQDGPYAPDNCRWANRIQQCLNKRTTIQVEWNGQMIPLPVLARSFGMPVDVVRCRYRNQGWPLRRCLTEPINRKNS
jgi:hypothetical protein